jgi:tRNA pseudouridine38-40 synthase
VRTLKLVLEYEGTRYFGWQRQKGQATVQEAVEAAVEAVTGRRATVHGAGRTDAGVHALGQAAHVRIAGTLPAERMMHALNAHLPDDIAVKTCEEAPDNFHARYDAAGKKYRYTVYNGPIRPAVERRTMLFIRGRLSAAAMRRAARAFVGRHDFRAFAATGSPVKSTVRTLRSVTVSRRGPVVTVDVVGDGFLYKMVRTLVGVLLEAGRGKIGPAAIRALLAPDGRLRAGPTVPAKGLCLMEVHY